MRHPRHSWISQDGFRIDKCENCGCIRYWDDGYGRMMYKKEISEGIYGPALFWSPSCKFVMITDKPIKI
jgi:hypothetical protein